MPLRKGSSAEVISFNISKLIKEGYKPAQAKAIAYNMARKNKTKKEKK